MKNIKRENNSELIYYLKVASSQFVSLLVPAAECLSAQNDCAEYLTIDNCVFTLITERGNFLCSHCQCDHKKKNLIYSGIFKEKEWVLFLSGNYTFST